MQFTALNLGVSAFLRHFTALRIFTEVRYSKTQGLEEQPEVGHIWELLLHHWRSTQLKWHQAFVF